jgi:Protein of unknown function (DUF2656)
MLLSHNFAIVDRRLPALSRDEFTAIFSQGFQSYPAVICRQIENPHWIVELCFPADQLSPPQLGELCGQFLASARRVAHPQLSIPDILVLGGMKTSPVTSSSPTSLQPGEWGVDVVETAEAQTFLAQISWDSTIENKAPDTIFKVEIQGTVA